MKRFIIVVCMFLLLAGCGKETAQTKPTESTQPYQLQLPPEDRNQTIGACDDFIEIPEGYYYVSNEGRHLRLYFCPRGDTTFHILCGKPNCNHTDENCNAAASHEVAYCNGALYTIDTSEIGKIKLVKMNLDGTDHQAVMEMTDKEKNFSCRFHHGKFFCVYMPDYDLIDTKEDQYIAVDLADFSQLNLATDYFHTRKFVDFGQFNQNKEYFTGRPKDEFYSSLEEQLVEVDINTGESRVLLKGYLAGIYVTDSTVYYMDPGSIAMESYYLREIEAEAEHSRFLEYDLASGETKSFEAPVVGEELNYAFYDEDFIYAFSVTGDSTENNDLVPEEQPSITLYFLSRDYKLLDQVTLDGGVEFAVAASDRIFFSNFYGTITYYLEKSEIGSHNLTLHPIQTVGVPEDARTQS